MWVPVPLTDVHLLFIFFSQLSPRNKYCFTETYDPIWLSIIKLLQILDRLPKYQILIEIPWTNSQLTLGCFKGPPCAWRCVCSCVRPFVTLLHSRLPVVIQLLSCVWLFATPWTAACKASLSFTISRSFLKCLEGCGVAQSRTQLKWLSSSIVFLDRMIS